MTFYLIPELASEVSYYLPLRDLMNWRLVMRNNGDYIMKIISREPIDDLVCKLLAPSEKLIKKYLSYILDISIDGKMEEWQMKMMYDYIVSHVDIEKMMKTHDPDYEWFAKLSVFNKHNKMFLDDECRFIYGYQTICYNPCDEDEYKLLSKKYSNGYCEDSRYKFGIYKNLSMIVLLAYIMY